MTFCRTIIAVAVLLISHDQTFALEGECMTTRVYYVNGINNTLAEAYHSAKLIESAYRTKAENRYPNQTFEFELSYNYSADFVRDLTEVIGQKMNEIDESDPNTFTAYQYLRIFMTVKDINTVLSNSRLKIIGSAIEEYLAGRITDIVNARQMIEDYRSQLEEQKRVLLIAHSQGNLFANQAIRALMGEYKESIGMIGVASPAADTYNNSPYLTLENDQVINLLRIFTDVLPANVDNELDIFVNTGDHFNHNFYYSYFTQGFESRKKIDEKFDLYLETLKPPEFEADYYSIKSCLEVWTMREPSLTIDNETVLQSVTTHRERSGYSDWQDPKSFSSSSSNSSESNIDVFIPDAVFLIPPDDRRLKPIMMPPICFYEGQVIPNRILVSDEWKIVTDKAERLVEEYGSIRGELELDMYGTLTTEVYTTSNSVSSYDTGCEVGDTLNVIVCKSNGQSSSEKRESISFDFLHGIGFSENEVVGSSENSDIYYGGGRISININSTTIGKSDWVAKNELNSEWGILHKHWIKSYIRLTQDAQESEDAIRKYCKIDDGVAIPDFEY